MKYSNTYMNHVILHNKNGNTSPGATLAILIIMVIFGYLAFDSMDPNNPSAISIHTMFAKCLGWSWWAKALSIVGPVVFLIIGSRLDTASGFGRLPSDDN